MDARFLCVYNLTRGIFLSSTVTVADCADQPLKMLKVLVSGLALDAESGFWLRPLSATPPVPRLFPFDLLYLDENHEIVDAVEVHPGADFPPYRPAVASALVLPLQTMQSTQTARGDRLIIEFEEEIERKIAAVDPLSIEPIAMGSKPSGRRLKEAKTSSSREAAFSRLESAVFKSSAAIAIPEHAVMVADRPDAGAGTLASALETSEVNGAAMAVHHPQAVVEKPAESDLLEEAAKPQTVEAESTASTEMPVISITEVILERSRSAPTPVIIGQHGGVEDLFSNWVDVPTPASAWSARNGVAQGNGNHSPAPVPSAAPGAAPEPLNAEQGNDAAPQKTAAEREGPAKQEDIAAPAGTQKSSTVWRPQPQALKNLTRPNAPVVAAGPAHTATPQPPLATTFTIAQYGVWRANGVSHVAAVQGAIAERRANSVAEGQSSNPRESEADSSRAEMAKAPASQARSEDLRALEDAPASARLAESPQESVPVPAAAESRPLDAMQNAVEPGADPAGAVEQALVAKDVVVASDKTETPQREVPGKDAGTSQQSAEAAGKKAVDSKAGEQTKAAVSRQPDEKKEPASTAHGELSLTLPLPSIRKAEEKGKLKISIQRVGANGKAKEQPLSLGTRFKRWLNPVPPVNSDRRKAHRRYVPGMVAHYFTGGAPRPHDVADISMTGFYLLTEDRWMPDTMIQMTLQKPCAKGERKQSITVLSKIVRRGSDGVAAQFVMPESLDPFSHDIQPSQATDRFALARFL